MTNQAPKEFTAADVAQGLKVRVYIPHMRCNSWGEVIEVNSTTCRMMWTNDLLGPGAEPLLHSINTVVHCLNDGTWKVA